MSTTGHGQISKQISDLVEDRAPVITMGEIAERRGGLAEHGVSRLAGRRRTTAVIATAVAAAAAISVVELGGGQASHVVTTAPRPVTHHARPVKLTAATVRRIARASDLALASAGHVLVAYADVVGTIPDGSGTLDINFSGQNFNSISHQPNTKPFTERVVDGQVYTFGDPPPGRPLQWYHSTTETSGGVSVPDPRKLLSALRPTAGFEVIGKQVIGGVPTTHLRATNVHGMNARLLSLDTADQPVSGLDIWVDNSGVVRLVAVRCEGISTPSQKTEVDTISIRFVDIGRPQTITAPAHYGNEVTHG